MNNKMPTGILLAVIVGGQLVVKRVESPALVTEPPHIETPDYSNRINVSLCYGAYISSVATSASTGVQWINPTDLA